MKNAAHFPPTGLPEAMHTQLSELRARYGHQLRKPLVHLLHKLNHRLSKQLDAHSQDARAKASRKAVIALLHSNSHSFSQLSAATGRHHKPGRT